MRRIILTEKLIYRSDGIKFGEWWDIDHEEWDWLRDKLAKEGKDIKDSAGILLTPDEWKDIEEKLDAYYEYNRAELDGLLEWK